MKVKILYARCWNNKTKKYYNLYIYALVDTKTGKGKKITFKDYENRRQQDKLDNWLK